jgi:hypothetical protein
MSEVGPNGTVRVYHGWYVIKATTGEMFALSPASYAALMREV